jgi:uncharacterized membrane protein YiaA
MNTILKRMRVLALYQMIGGVLAFLVSLSPPVDKTNSMIWFLSAAFFCAFSVFSGIMLFLKKPAGFPLTCINQLLQIPQIAVAGIVFRNVCGMGLHLGFDVAPVSGFKYDIQPPHFFLFSNVKEEIVYFTINIIAVALAFYAIVLMKKYKAAVLESERDNLNIGRNI